MIWHQVSNSYGNYNYNAYIYSDTVWATHFHGNYELVYCFEGTTDVIVNGIPDTLTTDELLLISPYAVHSLNIPKTSKTWIGVFSKDFINDFAQKYQFSAFGKFHCDREIKSFLKENLFVTSRPEHYMHIACLYLVCSQCLKNGKHVKAVDNPGFMEKTISYIAENLDKDISMESISDKLNYEYHYFSNLFHHCFSINFKKFINVLRFEEACKLLPDKSLSITDISNMCGFGSIRNFNRIFKEFADISPSEYRGLTFDMK